MEYQTDKITNKQLDKFIIQNNLPTNSLKISIPYLYFSDLVNLNWYDILFAIRNDFMSYQSAVEHAIIEVKRNKDYSETVFDLASLFLDEADSYTILPLLDKVIKEIPDEMKKDTKNRILYVLLNWIFEHRENYKDPLEVVEFVYDDFNFPKSMKSFVRYEPTDQPLSDNIEENIERLYNNWKDFLDAQRLKYS